MIISIESLLNKYTTVGIASYDAGGANLLNSLVDNFLDIKFYLYVDGPASKIFNNQNIIRVDSKYDLLDNVDLLILGTGGTDFEKNLLSDARENEIFTISILDHFVNYKKRFEKQNKFIFPNLCFVSDSYSYEIALKELHPYKDIHICRNYYLESLKTLFKDKINKKSKTVLYVLENLNEEWDSKPAWKTAFQNFYNNLFLKNNNLDKIIVRPHPKDDLSVYDDLHNFDNLSFDTNISGIKSLKEVSTVVGIESYFLHLASQCGFNVYTSIPKKIRKPRLPKESYKYIMH
jgi:hypothetical protein